MIPNKCIDLNEAGAAMIKAGRYDRAVSFLTNALRRFSVLDNETCKNEPDGPILDQWMLQESHLTSRYESKLLTNKNKTEARSSILFANPITIPKHQELPFPSTAIASFPALSSCIIFNLALALHLSATESPSPDKDENKSRLKKASRLYELAYNAQQEYAIDKKVNIYFTLAIVNNLGLLHRDLTELNTSKTYFDQLTKMLMYVVDYSRDNVSSMFQEYSKLEVFFHNAFSTSIKDSFPAAAA